MVPIGLLMPHFATAQRLLEGGQPFPMEHRTTALLVDDVDADGRLDIVAGDGRKLSVFLGASRTLLGTPRTYDAAAASLASGDLDRDGFPDLLAAGTLSVAVLLNRGDGSFEHTGDIATDSFNPRLAKPADLDGDGLLDVVVSGDKVQVLYGDGRGGFRDESILSATFSLRGVEVADFDDDGAVDVAIADTEGIHWHRGRGDGTFEEAATTVLSFMKRPWLLTSGDLVADGLTDLAVLTEDGDILLLANSGASFFLERFVTEVPDVDFPFAGPTLLETVDYDQDGFPDLITSIDGEGGPVFRVLLGLGDGTFSLELDVSFGEVSRHAEFADLDDDGHLDLVTTRSDVPELIVFRGKGTGRIERPTSIDLDTGPRGLAAIDVDRDGRTDLVAVSSAALHLVKADGAGGFARPLVTEFPARAFESVATGDFDGDGDFELALADVVGNEVAVVEFERGSPGRTIAHPSRELPVGLVPADFDGDGATDVAVGYRVHPEVSVFLRPGSEGADGRETRIAVGSAQAAMAAGDLDADGAVDLAVSTRDGLLLLLGDGAGHFPRLEAVDAVANSRSLRLADIDGDDKLDLMAVLGNLLVVVYAVGFDEEPERQEIDLGAGFRPLEIVDFSADGQLEAVTATRNAVAVIPLPSAGVVGASNHYSVGTSPRALALADFDGDGRLDCASADFDSRRITVLRGARTAAPVRFRRGDVDGNSRVELSDAVMILNRLFRSTEPLACPDAADIDDDGALLLTDAVNLLRYLFRDGETPPAPGPEACGADPSADRLAACSRTCR